MNLLLLLQRLLFQLAKLRSGFIVLVQQILYTTNVITSPTQINSFRHLPPFSTLRPGRACASFLSAVWPVPSELAISSTHLAANCIVEHEKNQ